MKQIFVLLIAFVLGATSAFADEGRYEPQALPKCTLYKTATGDDVCGYTLDEWKDALRVDAEVVSLRMRLKNEGKKNASLALQIESLQSQVRVYAKSQESLLERTTKLTADLIALDEKYQNERVRPRWESPLAWSIAAITSSLLVGILVRDVID